MIEQGATDTGNGANSQADLAAYLTDQGDGTRGRNNSSQHRSRSADYQETAQDSEHGEDLNMQSKTMSAVDVLNSAVSKSDKNGRRSSDPFTRKQLDHYERIRETKSRGGCQRASFNVGARVADWDLTQTTQDIIKGESYTCRELMKRTARPDESPERAHNIPGGVPAYAARRMNSFLQKTGLLHPSSGSSAAHLLSPMTQQTNYRKNCAATHSGSFHGSLAQHLGVKARKRVVEANAALAMSVSGLASHCADLLNRGLDLKSYTQQRDARLEGTHKGGISENALKRFKKATEKDKGRRKLKMRTTLNPFDAHFIQTTQGDRGKRLSTTEDIVTSSRTPLVTQNAIVDLKEKNRLQATLPSQTGGRSGGSKKVHVADAEDDFVIPRGLSLSRDAPIIIEEYI